ncbi:MAG: hypothetical protein IT177_01590 [Acidobacteria bacterium]|nr:hypothetical protein [Acidobacteriota bacterium]
MNQFPVQEWLVESARLTFFPAPEPFESDDWWDSVAGIPAETVITKKLGAEILRVGTRDGRALELAVSPLRIEWRLRAPEAEGTDVPRIPPNIGVLEDSLTLVKELAERWFTLPTCPSAARLAFGAILFHPEETPQAAFERLEAYVPVTIGTGNPPPSDFTYQINRPRKSSVLDGLDINRLSRWSRGRFNVLAVLQQGVQAIVAHTELVEPQYSARVELDVNTSPSFNKALTREQCLHVFAELLILAREIAESGDTP